MGWDRQAPEVMEVPTPIVLGRWVLAAIVAMLAGALLFLLHVSERVPPLQALNVWALSGSPMLIWVLTFGARAYFYGGVLSHQQFLEEEAHGAQQAWQDWAQRYLAVHASCVLLPDQVSANVLTQVTLNVPRRTSQARRIAALPAGPERALAGLQWLLQGVAPVLQVLPAGQELRVTLLSDVEPQQYQRLRDAWEKNWATTPHQSPAPTLSAAAELPYQWIDETLKTASRAVELLLVVQVHGEDAYSDGLAALLLCPDRLAYEWDLPVQGRLLRPMPLDIETLESDVALFLQTQTGARQAMGLLADGAHWQPLIAKALLVGGAHGASLEVEQQWVQEHFCGLPGPFGHWLLAALAVEMVQQKVRSLLMLTEEKTRRWISTVAAGDLA